MNLLKAIFAEFSDDDAPRLAAAIAFYTAVSLPPLLILLTLGAGMIWEPEAVRGQLVGEIGTAIGPTAAEQIRTILEETNRPDRGSATGFLSLGALLFGATSAFAQLQEALNRAWDVRKDSRGALLSMVIKRVLSFGMIVVVAFLLLVSMALSALLSTTGEALVSILPAGFDTVTLWSLDLGLSLLIATLLFMAMFRILPDAELAWVDVWLGALVTGLLFIAGKFLLSLYIGSTNPGSAFGAAGSLVIVLLWVYYSTMIVLLGAEFTQVWARRHGRRIEPADGAVRA